MGVGGQLQGYSSGLVATGMEGSSISERKKSLEAQQKASHEKTVTIEYTSNFSIKPLIYFFNRTFGRKPSYVNISQENLKQNEDFESFKEQKEYLQDQMSIGKSDDVESECGSFVSCCSSLNSDSWFHSFEW